MVFYLTKRHCRIIILYFCTPYDKKQNTTGKRNNFPYFSIPQRYPLYE
jgi:hypothetical protein